MDTKDEMKKFDKYDFFETLLVKSNELTKSQRQYRHVFCTKLKSRKQLNVEAGIASMHNQLADEIDELRGKIWVANGKTNRIQSYRSLKLIKCHVECQEHLEEDINKLKKNIVNMEHEISRMNKVNYQLLNKTHSDQSHYNEVQKQRKRLSILEDRLEASTKQEGAFATENAAFREQLVNILHIRSIFNDSYTKFMRKLDSDRKYMIDMIAYARGMFDNCIDLYEKTEMTIKQERREFEMRRRDMQDLQKKFVANKLNAAFIDCKGKGRELAELQPKEFRRREKFRTESRRKVNLYDSVLKKIKEFTDSSSVAEVIAKFNEQEGIYYSYFNYNNEMTYHVTLLNNSVNQLYTDISNLMSDNKDTLQSQVNRINELQSKVRDQEEFNEKLATIRTNNDMRLEKLLQSLEAVCDICRINKAPLSLLLISNRHINLVNLAKFMELLQIRLYGVVASVYIDDKENRGAVYRTVKSATRPLQPVTPLDRIVLTQQCPECAETDAQNIEEGGDLSHPHTKKESKKQVYEKVVQPEIQYRLHSLSQCALPHSRLLMARRNI
ncbi:hypothetical protein KR018_007077 [Drosophila ironensis]|nr:hypothetical protein KR018_007077 [Drosophila ironensis]